MKSRLFQIIIFFIFVIPAYAQKDTKHEEAIKKLIDVATVSLYTKDMDTYRNTWINEPYMSRIYINNGRIVKSIGDDLVKLIDTWDKTWKPSEVPKFTRDNWTFRIKGKTAFVVFEQHEESPNGGFYHTIQERYLEIKNKEWKIVNVTVIAKNN